MTFHILTLFPGMFRGFLEETMMKRALEAGVVRVNLVNIRDYATDKHRTTDDTPYGGGPGMVMKVEPIYRALETLKGVGPGATLGTGRGSRESGVGKRRTVLLSPRGNQFDQRAAEKYAKLDDLTLICGRYEGVDQRVADHLCDEELSVGPYVLSGGEVAAMVVAEAVSRLLPGFLGNPESLKEESFTPGLPREAPSGGAERSGEYSQYTKPEDFQGWKVPKVLLSGDHAEIKKWRRTHTKKRSRPTHYKLPATSS